MRSQDANKFAGRLIGQCLGDALGFIVEGQLTASCSSYIDDVVRTGKTRQLRRGRYSFGQYSDDSQLARELILSIVDRGSSTQPITQDVSRRSFVKIASSEEASLRKQLPIG